MKRAALLALGVLAAAHEIAAQSVPIIPRPAVVRNLNGSFLLGRSTLVYADADARQVADGFREQIRSEFGIALDSAAAAPARDTIRFLLDGSLPEESYRLRIEPAGITIVGAPAGLFYGAQSLLQLVSARTGKPLTFPAVEIEDQPRFPYRGLHLDTSRHMFPVEFLKRYLDWMARYKLNRFHWQLTDDQGWRIEIQQYPRLTQIASMRKETLVGHAPQSTKYDGKPYGGF